MTYREQCDARMEKMQRRRDAGLISVRFPEVLNIAVDMKHLRKGTNAVLLMRTLFFLPDSYAYFHAGCLSNDCKDCIDGVDLDQVVTAMIRSHTALREGEFECENGPTSSHLNISYKITIQYNKIS